MAPLDRRFLSRLRSQTLQNLTEGSVVLEIGAGTGLNAAYYPNRASGVASELSCKMLEIARTKIWPEGIDFVQCDAESLPFADNAFDATFATLVFCSIPSPQNAFAEIRRVVKPGGTVALLEHVRPANILGPLFDLANLLTVPLFEDHFNRRTADEARKAGLEITGLSSHALGIVQSIVCRVPG